MELLKKGFSSSKGSKFYAYLYALDSFDSYKEVLKEVFLKHKKANHHCYALRFDDDAHFSNDGEVGEPAKFMLFYLEQKGFDNHMIVVSRIFGGVKLGVGGVSRCFREAVKNLE